MSKLIPRKHQQQFVRARWSREAFELMTVIAGFIVDGLPIVMGDILLSGPEVPGQSINLPTIGDSSVVFPQGSGFTVTGVRQKVSIVSDNVVIAWTGTAFAASVIIKELRNETNKKPLTQKRLLDYFNQLERSGINETLRFIGSIRERNMAHTFGYNSPRCETQQLGIVYSAGTGSDDMKRLMDALPRAKSDKPQTADPAVRALCKSLYVSGGLLMNEVASRESLLQYYGAGYELATFNNGRFRKLGDITYIFWYVEVDETGINISPPREIFKYQYFNDVLLIRSAKLNDPRDLRNLSFEDSIHAIAPIYRDITNEDVSSFRLPDMNSRFLCNYFFIRTPDFPIYTFAPS